MLMPACTVDNVPADADILIALLHVFGTITKFFNFNWQALSMNEMRAYERR